MFQFTSFASYSYVFRTGYSGINQSGLPHWEISGSKPVCGSPKHIAAYHVLHRLSLPSHSSFTLSSLTTYKKICSFYPLFSLSYIIVKDRIHVRKHEWKYHRSDISQKSILNPIILNLVELRRIELLTLCLQSRCSPS